MNWLRRIIGLPVMAIFVSVLLFMNIAMLPIVAAIWALGFKGDDGFFSLNTFGMITWVAKTWWTGKDGL